MNKILKEVSNLNLQEFKKILIEWKSLEKELEDFFIKNVNQDYTFTNENKLSYGNCNIIKLERSNDKSWKEIKVYYVNIENGKKRYFNLGLCDLETLRDMVKIIQGDIKLYNKLESIVCRYQDSLYDLIKSLLLLSSCEGRIYFKEEEVMSDKDLKSYVGSIFVDKNREENIYVTIIYPSTNNHLYYKNKEFDIRDIELSTTKQIINKLIYRINEVNCEFIINTIL